MREIDYEKVMVMLNRMSREVARKHREEIISDALLLIYENGKAINGKKVKPFVRRCFVKSRNKYFKKLKKYDILIGGLEDIEKIENDGGGRIL